MYYLDKLKYIITDSDISIQSLHLRIDALAVTAHNKLNIEDSHIFNCAISTAKYSLQYWEINLPEWYEVFGITTTKGWFSWKDVGVADVAGAVAGATGCETAALCGPIGWKVWAAGVIGGSAGSSAYSAVEQVLKHYL